MEIVIVTGLSGAGKTQAVHCLEDLGYYCVDNIPPKLISEFIGLAEKTRAGMKKLGFVVDIRGGEFFDGLMECIEDLKTSGYSVKLMFLEASDATLIRRYKETRRTHPLDVDGNINEAIRLEREKLGLARKKADFVIDTSKLKKSQLYKQVMDYIEPGKTESSFMITVQSFGYKFGMPLEADWVLDVRFIPNPYYVESLRNLTGQNKKIREYVLKNGEACAFAEKTADTVCGLIPSYVREGKYNLNIAVGCTGGRHRSVVVAEELAELLKERGKRVVVMHRELDKG